MLLLEVNEANIKFASEIIRDGGVVIYPTETVYGIGCDPSIEFATKRVCDIKGRDKKEMTSHVMPQDRLQQYLKERYSMILTDDYVPVDNLIAPIFEERFGYQR